MKAIQIILIALFFFTVDAKSQLIGKTREQIMKINYGRGRHLDYINEAKLVFKEGDLYYIYKFEKLGNNDTCYMQLVMYPETSLSNTVKEYTLKHKLVRSMSWVDKDSMFLYTIVNGLEIGPDWEDVFFVKMEDFARAEGERLAKEYIEIMRELEK